MTTENLKQIGELLSKVGSPGTFACRRTAPADDLLLEVRGVGRLRFPVWIPASGSTTHSHPTTRIRLSGRVAYMDIGQNYEPGIGFVPRPDQKNLSLSGSFYPRRMRPLLGSRFLVCT